MLGNRFGGSGRFKLIFTTFRGGFLKYYSITMAVGGWVIMKAGVGSRCGQHVFVQIAYLQSSHRRQILNR